MRTLIMKTKLKCDNCAEVFEVEHNNSKELKQFSFCPVCNTSNVKEV